MLRKMKTRTSWRQANQPWVQLIGVQKGRVVKIRRAEVQVLTKLCEALLLTLQCREIVDGNF